MNRFTFVSKDESDTQRLGAAIADAVPDGTTLALCGTLGAGKTRLTQAIAVASGVRREDVMSPTFVLCHEYLGQRPIYHLDAYRVKDDDEFIELGVDEYFESAGITIVEWADRVADCLPTERVNVDIEIVADDARVFQITVTSDRLQPTLSRLKKILEGS